MSLVKINWKPNEKELRDFGRVGVIATAVIAALLYIVKGLAIKWCLLIFGVGVFIFAASIISIKFTRLIYVGLTAAGYPIGLAVSFLVLAIFFYLIITPLGLIFRLFGRDPMMRYFEPEAKSYWIPRRKTDKLDRYFHQF